MPRPLIVAITLLAVSGCGSVGGPTVDVPGFARVDGPWSATPIPVPPAILAAADQACRTSMQPFPNGVQIVVTDARGKGVLQLAYAGQNAGPQARIKRGVVDVGDQSGKLLVLVHASLNNP